MVTIESFAQDLGSYLEPDQVDLVVKAYHFAEDAHEGQKRKSGEPYITHPLAVAGILSEMHMDHQCLMAALLHDVIEDTGVPKHTISQEFDEDVANLVDGVSKLKNIFQSRAEAQAENFQKMTLAMARDIRVILVKLADRLHNMRTLGHLDPERRRRIAKETLEIYAPIALRLGMNNIRVELEELGFKALYPLRSSMIQKAVKRARGNRKEVVNSIKLSISECLESENIKAKVFGREKHLWSIYDKMRTKRRSFNEIMDVYAFRILVDSVDQCYRVLGVVHNLYKPVVGRFKDYIAIPKANGYQSLHTTLFGKHGIPIEIQIRTHEMELLANNGIAGHWLYKTADESSGSHQRAREWMKGLLEIQQSTGNSLEFIEHVKIDLFPDEVYVFSPIGEIFDLPHGATPVDFAYAVHTDIGNSCVACRIDRRLAPLSATLESGQTVEIIRAPGAQPNPAWLDFVITGKARSSIRHALKNQQRNESTLLGERLLKRALEPHHMVIQDIDPAALATLLEERKIDSLDDLLAEIGIGNQMAGVIVKRLLGDSDDVDQASHGPLAIKGTEGLVVSYAKCCKPIPGDHIIGHVSAGRGIVIHRDTCKNMVDLQEKPEELMAVRWDPLVDQEFSVDLRLELEHERGMIAVIASTVTNNDASIQRINMIEKDAKLAIITMIISVKDRVHLASLIKRLRAIKGINRITRAK
ncbi:MAG: bifunctional GTP diphosphokinase/guanosine-3',5'-bis pyrophosphate 3'-pyrophosphohydrolase [Proteobacteria bacterium]|nr:bifunctional GTP diphosphokinase/guanosine-3',5'-bis pyrophosphate 3'-pyrophosphohydrolase [Pseudomonadota bacterium]